MAATAIDRVTRYAAPGVLKIVVMPAVAATNGVPTRAEIDAGLDVSCEVAGWEGFSKSISYIETPDLCSDTTGKIVGRATMDDSAITFYADREGEDIRDEIEDGDEKWIAFMWGGDVEDTKMDVFHVVFAAHQTTGDIAGTSYVAVRYAVSIIGAPAQDVAVPAAGGGD